MREASQSMIDATVYMTGNLTPDEFRDWVTLALAGMPPDIRASVFREATDMARSVAIDTLQ